MEDLEMLLISFAKELESIYRFEVKEISRLIMIGNSIKQYYPKEKRGSITKSVNIARRYVRHFTDRKNVLSSSEIKYCIKELTGTECDYQLLASDLYVKRKMESNIQSVYKRYCEHVISM